ncbi:MAG: nitrous oxide reductase accessory protein NosL [Myxococcales bacterium]
MKIALLALAIGAGAFLFWKPAPASGPEPVRYGRDACDRCRMHLATPGFAGERRDEKGVLHKYDDLGCMLIAASHAASGEAWVEDHEGSGFVPLLSASFVSGKDLGTPMNYGVVAFRDAAAAAKFAAAHGARVVALEQLLTGFQEVHR